MSDCIIWSGRRRDRHGYGLRGSDGGECGRLVHRQAYIAAKGSIPPGMHIHHLCQVKLCVNPDHLVALTPGEHRRVHADEITHCVNGHEFTRENTYIRPESLDGGRRNCRACNADAQRRCRERRAA